jgi:hypothetical protein
MDLDRVISTTVSPAARAEISEALRVGRLRRIAAAIFEQALLDPDIETAAAFFEKYEKWLDGSE